MNGDRFTSPTDPPCSKINAETWRRWYEIARREAQHQQEMAEGYERIACRWERAFWLGVPGAFGLGLLVRMLLWS